MDIIVPNLNDYAKVNDLAVQVHEIHVAWRPDLFISSDIVITKENYELMINNKELYVAKINNEIVGYIIFNIREKINPIMRYRKLLNIEAMCIDENNRHKGIGTALLSFAKKIGEENGCTDLYLTVNEENINGIAAYEKFGFKIKNLAYSMEINK